MTKTERIIEAHDAEIILIVETLQDLVKTNQSLMESIESLATRIAMLEARPIYPQWTYTTPEPVTPSFWDRNTSWPTCTCGSTGGCALHPTWRVS